MLPHNKSAHSFSAFVFPLVAAMLAFFATARPAEAQPSSTVLTKSLTSPSTLGAALTLTATVTPGTATGKVTFFDGAAILGTGTLSGGAATLTTRLLGSGDHKLRARYLGGLLPASTSPVIFQTVNSRSQTGFSPGGTYNVGPTPWGIAAADFNGDGFTDLAVANFGTNSVSVFKGVGNGTFLAAVNFTAGAGPIAVAAGDFDGDGKTDLAVANYNADTISILLGDGAGSFGTATSFSSGGVNPSSSRRQRF